MKKNKQSWRHHFLPQFYIKSFCEENQKTNIYKKEYDKFGKTSPKHAFFEHNKNTLENYKGEIDNTFEKMYADIESQIAIHYNKFVIGDALDEGSSKIKTEIMRNLIWLAYILKWRSPLYEEAFLKIQECFSFLDLTEGVQYFNEYININAEELYDSPQTQEIKRLMLATRLFGRSDYKKIFGNCFKLNSPSPILLGDCPFAELQVTDGGEYEDFIFPLTSNYRLVYSSRVDKNELIQYLTLNGKFDEFLQQFAYLCDLATCELSAKQIVCADENYLKFVVTQHKKIVNQKKVSKNGHPIEKELIFLPFNYLYNYQEIGK